jgi:uncharacterized membrane protein
VTVVNDFVAGPAGPYLAIVAMAVATYACRAGGVVLMSRVRLTPAVERALRALPGSIVVATVLPIALRGGAAAMIGLAAALLVMIVTRHELPALVAGLAAVSAVRAVGL